MCDTVKDCRFRKLLCAYLGTENEEHRAGLMEKIRQTDQYKDLESGNIQVRQSLVTFSLPDKTVQKEVYVD